MAILILIFSSSSFSQVPVFYCNKDGAKSITDRPCETFGAVEERKIEGRVQPVVKPDPMTTIIVCRAFDRQKQQILDDQYYRGVPASAKQLNELDAAMIKRGCPLN